MTDNMKKFLEEVSKDKELIEKLSKAETPEAVIALAKEIGFELTAEDLKSKETISEISDDELEDVAGGKKCYCVLGGGGTGEEGVSKTCACVHFGFGENDIRERRCACCGYGEGDAY